MHLKQSHCISKQMTSMRYLFLLALFVSCSNSVLNEKASKDGEPEPNYDSLRVVLERMYDLDQNVRAKYNSSGNFDGKFNNEMLTIDSINQYNLNIILNSYGWLAKSKIGPKASDAIFYIIQHGSDEMIEEHIEELKSLAEIGEANKRHVAMMEDRLLMHKNQKQIYGTQAYILKLEDGSWDSFIWPIENPESVNDRRMMMEIETSIEEYANRHGYRYDPNEPLPQK